MALKRKTHKYISDLMYAFNCFGHPNIRAKHSKTIEFTKDADISIKADCIIGVRADFKTQEIKKFTGKIFLTVECDGIIDEFHAIVNPGFKDDREVVFRKGKFISQRTFGVMLNKGADGLKREIANKMREPDKEMRVTIFQKPIVKLLTEQGSR